LALLQSFVVQKAENRRKQRINRQIVVSCEIIWLGCKNADKKAYSGLIFYNFADILLKFKINTIEVYGLICQI
jgi:hypothetical protein